MTPKEKANELIKSYFNKMNENYDSISWNQAKQCAVIAIDVILDLPDIYCSSESYDYWNEVKNEIYKF